MMRWLTLIEGFEDGDGAFHRVEHRMPAPGVKGSVTRHGRGSRSPHGSATGSWWDARTRPIPVRGTGAAGEGWPLLSYPGETITVGDQGTEFQHGFGATQRPAGSGDSNPVGDQLTGRGEPYHQPRRRARAADRAGSLFARCETVSRCGQAQTVP